MCHCLLRRRGSEKVQVQGEFKEHWRGGEGGLPGRSCRPGGPNS